MYEAQHSVSGKIVVVGDGACGKTCLLEVFKRNKFPDEYIPTVVDNFVKEVKINETESVNLTLWDTAGQEDYDSVRPLSYKDTDLVLLCYTIENCQVLSNIPKKWLFEIKNYCPSANFFLIGLKKDIRDEKTSNVQGIVSYEDGQNMANEIGAKAFIECSAKTGENVDRVFLESAKHITAFKKRMKEQPNWFRKIFCCGLC